MIMSFDGRRTSNRSRLSRLVWQALLLSGCALFLVWMLMAIRTEPLPSTTTIHNNHNQFQSRYHDPPRHHHLHRRRLLGEPNWTLEQARSTHLPMFQVADYTTIGPTSFPKPTALLQTSPKDEIVPVLRPSFGTHRPEQDAILVFAAEYGVQTYLVFLETLQRTGYTGDVVFCISKLDYNNMNVRSYLQSDLTVNVILYVVEFTCFNAEQEIVDSMDGGMRVCQCHFLYGRKTGSDNITALKDPRPPRTVPTTRYELYWIWVLNYHKHSWIMLIDARDTIFQTNPFDKVPRDAITERESGVLFFFGVRSWSFLLCFAFCFCFCFWHIVGVQSLSLVLFVVFASSLLLDFFLVARSGNQSKFTPLV